MWAALSESRIANRESGIESQEDRLIPDAALATLRVPRWRQAVLRPFVRRAINGEAALVSSGVRTGPMRFLGVLLVDRAPTSAWAATCLMWCRVACSPAGAGYTFATIFLPGKPSGAASPLASFTYPLHVLARGVGARLRAVIRHS